METKYLENQPYFSRKNLELLMGFNRRTLDDRIKSQINRGTLMRLKQGFYLSIPYYKNSTNKKALLEYIGSIINYPSYISLEYAMDSYNLLAESVFGITYVTSKKPKKIVNNIVNYSYRNLKDDLFFGYEPKSFEDKQYQFATPAKSIFDFFYFLKELNDDDLTKYILKESRINWDNLKSKDKLQLKSIIKSVNSPKMKKVLNVLIENNIL